MFAYCGARLASGIITFEEVGPAYDVNEIVTHELIPYKVEKSVITGMIANAEGQDAPAFEGEVPFCQSFGFVEEGKPLLMVSESLHIQAALNCENMAEKYDLHAGSDWTMKIEKR